MNGFWTRAPDPPAFGFELIGELRPNLFTELTDRLVELKMDQIFFARPKEQQLAFSRGELLLVCSTDLKIAALVNAAVFMADYKAKMGPKPPPANT
jgi:hypothetical protein